MVMVMFPKRDTKVKYSSASEAVRRLLVNKLQTYTHTSSRASKLQQTWIHIEGFISDTGTDNIFSLIFKTS